MKILVTGSSGYVGSLLVPFLLADGHTVVGFDINWFGDGFLPKGNDRLRAVVGDIRDVAAVREAAQGCDVAIHLACISNDHSCQLDRELSQSVNIDAFEPLVRACKDAGVRRFIYASSSSVYGVSDAPDVREDHPLVPLTIYNESKAECERRLWPHQGDDFVCVAVRPATVCGRAPRQRFDLTVNILTAHAVRAGKMTVFGGRQKRPNLHIRDMVDCYRLLIDAPAGKIAGQVFNVGARNMTVMEAAHAVQAAVHRSMGVAASIETTESTDTRSYHVNSDKIRDVLGFAPKRTVEDAIRELCDHFKTGMWPDALTNPIYTNILQLKGLKVEDSLASYRSDRYAKT